MTYKIKLFWKSVCGRYKQISKHWVFWKSLQNTANLSKNSQCGKHFNKITENKGVHVEKSSRLGFALIWDIYHYWYENTHKLKDETQEE